MSTILHITASIRDGESVSRSLSSKLVDGLREKSGADVITRDLSKNDIPFIDEDRFESVSYSPEFVALVLEQMDLAEHARKLPSRLSGGQRQRVAIARALANDPAIILADEPTGNLDSSTGEEIIDLLQKMSRERGVTIISATHDFKMLNVSDRVVWIRDGRIDRIENRDELNISLGTIQERHDSA